MTLTIKLDRNWSSFQLANSTPPLSVTGSAIAPSARMLQNRVICLSFTQAKFQLAHKKRRNTNTNTHARNRAPPSTHGDKVVPQESLRRCYLI